MKLFKYMVGAAVGIGLIGSASAGLVSGYTLSGNGPGKVPNLPKNCSYIYVQDPECIAQCVLATSAGVGKSGALRKGIAFDWTGTGFQGRTLKLKKPALANLSPKARFNYIVSKSGGNASGVTRADIKKYFCNKVCPFKIVGIVNIGGDSRNCPPNSDLG